MPLLHPDDSEVLPDSRQKKKALFPPAAYSSPLMDLVYLTNLEPWLSQETEISSRRSLLSNKILFNGRGITESLIIQRNRPRGKNKGCLCFFFPFCILLYQSSLPQGRDPGIQNAIVCLWGSCSRNLFGCSYTLPVSSPCGLFNAGLCLH